MTTRRKLEEQTDAILERIARFDNKLYLEFGGKLLFDHHASRVLPGFDPNVKMRLPSKLSGMAEIIICVYAGEIERKKMRADFGISYDADTFKLIDNLREWGLKVRAVVITRFTGQPAAAAEFRDVNLIDPFHLDAHGVTAVNYNRDVEAFPLLRRILEMITGGAFLYQSPVSRRD